VSLNNGSLILTPLQFISHRHKQLGTALLPIIEGQYPSENPEANFLKYKKFFMKSDRKTDMLSEIS